VSNRDCEHADLRDIALGALELFAAAVIVVGVLAVFRRGLDGGRLHLDRGRTQRRRWAMTETWQARGARRFRRVAIRRPDLPS
jgi:hypothetical protein